MARTAAGMPPRRWCSAQALQRRTYNGPRPLQRKVRPRLYRPCDPPMDEVNVFRYRHYIQIFVAVPIGGARIVKIRREVREAIPDSVRTVNVAQSYRFDKPVTYRAH